MLDFLRDNVTHVTRDALINRLEGSGYAANTGRVITPADRGSRVYVTSTSGDEAFSVTRDRHRSTYRVVEHGVASVAGVIATARR